MKKTLLIILLFCIATICFAQSDPIKFLGIPVDGPRAQFESSLKAKGFKYDSIYEEFKGQFNGKSVEVVVHTNHDIVDRVVVLFPKTSEQNIRSEYNLLLKQFNETGKYIGFLNEEIPASEKIPYEMTANNKDYQCTFSYFDPNRDPAELSDALADKVLSEVLTEEELANYKEESKNMLNMPDEQKTAVFQKILSEITSGLNDDSIDPEKAYSFIIAFVNAVNELADGRVWFRIDESCRQIILYYDNLHNQAHGEDL